MRRSTLRRFAALLPLCLLACSGDPSGGQGAPASVAIAATGGSLSVVAGALGGSGNRDGSGVTARFNQPLGVAVAADGTTYVADLFNHVIRKISPAGEVTTLAGQAGTAGAADGTGSSARFRYPGGVAVAADGTLYVADSGNYTLRKVTPAGEVTTLAGQAGSAGAVDGSGAAARFRTFYGMALASDGLLYVADPDNHSIRRVTAAGEVSTLAGSASVSGSSDGTGTAARFARPAVIAIDAADVLYVTDPGNHNIRKVTTAGVVTTLAGGAGVSGSGDGNGTAARFNYPFGITVAADGTLYVADTLNHLIRAVTSAGEVTTLAGQAGSNGFVDGSGSAARFDSPGGIVLDGSGELLVADSYNHSLRRLTLAGATTTVYGMGARTGSVDASGEAARFDGPVALASGADGILRVADSGSHVLRAISAAGEVTTLAGLAGAPGAADGAAAVARFRAPGGLALDAGGTLYVADTDNHVIRKVSPAGEVSTLAGGAGLAGAANGSGSLARFDSPRGLALDSAGNLYVADTGNHLIRRITPAGAVSTVAGLADVAGTSDGAAGAARFNRPAGLALGLEGTLYVADEGNHLVRAVSPAGVVSTVAGGVQLAGAVDGTGTSARFNGPVGIVVDADGVLYVTDAGNHLLRRVSPAREVTTLAGVAGVEGVVTGALPAGLSRPAGIALGGDGELYLTGENAILKAELATPAATFGVGLRTSAAALVLGQSVTLSWSTLDATGCVASGDWSGAQANAGTQTLVPAAAGSYSYTLTCDEAGGGASKAATVSVTVTHPAPTLALSASAPFVAPGSSLTLTWSSANVTACTASGDWSGARATSGNATLTPDAGARSYTLECSGPGGSVSRTVEVAVALPPTVTVTASPASVSTGISTLLTWSSTGAASCSASGGWSGARATSGSTSVTPTGSSSVTYYLSCTGDGGTTVGSVTVKVRQGGTAAASSGGGALGLEGLGLLALLLLRRRRA